MQFPTKTMSMASRVVIKKAKTLLQQSRTLEERHKLQNIDLNKLNSIRLNANGVLAVEFGLQWSLTCSALTFDLTLLQSSQQLWVNICFLAQTELRFAFAGRMLCFQKLAQVLFLFGSVTKTIQDVHSTDIDFCLAL
jgi:hypothetical protein